jgi:hypothetical protein
MEILTLLVGLMLYAPLYLPLILGGVLAYHKSWVFACAFWIAWLATVTARGIALSSWHLVDGDVAQSFRDAGISLYWMWMPGVIANVTCILLACLIVVLRKKREPKQTHSEASDS